MSKERHLTPEEVAVWKAIAAKLREASEAVEEARLIMIEKLDFVQQSAAWSVLDVAEDALRGQAYMFSPQSEWLGGTIEQHVEAYRPPHIYRPKLTDTDQQTVPSPSLESAE